VTARSITNYYQLLCVAPTASAQQIQGAYDVLLQLNSLSSLLGGTTREEFDRVTHAYNVLSDPRQRQRYDRLSGGLRLAPPGALSQHVRQNCALERKRAVAQGWLLGALGIAVMVIIGAGMALIQIGTP